METSRIIIIRVGTRNCIVPIAAVSQEHILVHLCITRKITRPGNDMVLVLVSKIDIVVWVVEIDVISVWGTGVDLDSV